MHLSKLKKGQQFYYNNKAWQVKANGRHGGGKLEVEEVLDSSSTQLLSATMDVELLEQTPEELVNMVVEVFPEVILEPNGVGWDNCDLPEEDIVGDEEESTE